MKNHSFLILSIALATLICFFANIIEPHLLEYGVNDYDSLSFISGLTFGFSTESILILLYKKKIANNKELVSLLSVCLLFCIPYFDLSKSNIVKFVGCLTATIIIFFLYKKRSNNCDNLIKCNEKDNIGCLVMRVGLQAFVTN